ncbi:DUF6160 family protein [Alkalimarinus alittae]|uniref:DUF6160 family protein n=1 Tax=Alkalimarinus alittae TaxID=2961619 RepID=A0ABY6N6W1_9ALTE|nr:DUF6160 family protein [Alkalimarinus alittae]UZE97829.1 DUF6160 family protein [Alkalimarinus alittae]UZE97831.1 DUF6160 family protein [Alkalimarinus alittae]
MKGLNKIALVTAITAISAGAQAELKSLDDAVMGEMTGQAGLTIDLTANVKVGEIAYKDGGFISMTGMELGGSGIVTGDTSKTALDNITITVDVAGAGESNGDFKFGLEAQINDYIADSPATGLADLAAQTSDLKQQQAIGAYAAHRAGTYSGTPGDADVTSVAQLLETGAGLADGAIADGDLVIHLGTTNGYDAANTKFDGVDFGFKLGEVALRKSDYVVGSSVDPLAPAAAANTVLVSGIALGGKIGPVDIIIDEDTSKLAVSAYFQVEGGVAGNSAANAMKFDFMDVEIGRFAMNNSRGANKLATAGYAHAAAVVSASAKGLFIDVKDFSADMDMEDIYLGGTSIGSVYITDLEVTATMDVYGH